MSNIARMRTVKQIVEYFKSVDSCSSISEYYIRTLVKTKQIQTFKTGTKILINLDKLIEYFNSELVEDNESVQEYGKLRRVGD